MDDIKLLIENDKNFCLLIKEIVELQERVKELEKCNKCQNKFRNATQEEKDCVYDYMLKTSKKAGVNIRDYDKSVDEMFKELGYKKISDCEYKRIKPDKYGREVFITIDDGEVIKYIKNKELNVGIAEWIFSKELKAINKKIEEMKNGSRN